MDGEGEIYIKRQENKNYITPENNEFSADSQVQMLHMREVKQKKRKEGKKEGEKKRKGGLDGVFGQAPECVNHLYFFSQFLFFFVKSWMFHHFAKKDAFDTSLAARTPPGICIRQ